MALFTKESLETLKEKVDLVEVLSSHLSLKRTGSSFKTHCPFHQEKTPSFIVQAGDTHYHCFGCGAHGDAIHFLMSYLKLSFVEAVELLAEKFGVLLQKSDEGVQKGANRKELKEVLEYGARFYHYTLLHTKEGRKALFYLYERGIDLEFIRRFQIGWAPSSHLFWEYMKSLHLSDEILQTVGLLSSNSYGKKKEFFSERVVIPIKNSMGAIVGFSGRKVEESTFGPKYINTPETPLFKKSRILFGLSESRKRITQEKKVLIVEGQFDALRLIYAGWDYTVAPQGTSFTQDHVEEIKKLGVEKIVLCMDGDEAGKIAAIKIGDLFQKEGKEVKVICLPQGKDPDTFLREKGPLLWEKEIEKGKDYLSFLVEALSKNVDLNSPASKGGFVEMLEKKIRSWDHPVMVHESLKKLAKLTRTPESVLGIGDLPERAPLQTKGNVSPHTINGDQVLESDLLRWLFLLGQDKPHFLQICKNNLQEEDFYVPICREFYKHYLHAGEEKRSIDLLSFAIDLQGEKEQEFLSNLLEKKINREKAEDLFLGTIQKILERNWMVKKEEIKEKIHQGNLPSEKSLELAKEFSFLQKQRPAVKLLS